VCEVRFTEWTEEGLMRHPVFLGLRTDKDPKEVVREEARPLRRYLPGRQKRTEEETVEAGGREVKVTNPSKVFWPDEGYTKGDLIDYYRAVAGEIVPFLRDRAESLHRFPDGIYGKDFYHKDVGGIAPDWVRTFTVHEPGEEAVTYMLCQDEASLLFMINLGCIDVNPWNSRVQKPGFPDYMVFDFDPLMVPFSDVVEAVLATHDVLDRIGCRNYCKTSGATGMHIYVPLGARYTHLQAREFAELVNRRVNAMLPSITSLERMPRKRERKVYLDFLQNAEGKTMAAPFSVRPKEKASVSCPLEWKEVTRSLDASRFTIRTMPDMIGSRHGIWEGVLGKGVDLARCLDRLAGLYKEG
jgi:bifunctional non-homologous end joining protein LigD